MRRLIAAIAAALILPACGSYHHHDEDNWLILSNAGTGMVIVTIEHGEAGMFDGSTEFHHTYELAAGVQRTDAYPWTHQVRVQVHRKSDGLLLFSEMFDLNDFEDHDRRVWITITP